MSVYRMANPVKAYAWGSRDGLATLQGREPAEEPEAELWIGAHPQASSALEGVDELGGRLDALVAAHPERLLGADVVARFGPRLPFMMKVLSAARPLSLQVHPDDALARRGFDEEDAAGVDPSAPSRVYRDPHGKPEMLMAVTPFEALLGFRAAGDAADCLAALGVSALSPVVEMLRSGRATGEAFLALLDWPDDDRAELVSAVRAAAANSGDPLVAWARELAEHHPADPGVVAMLMLNYVKLQPGQAIFVAPGQIHAYLQGTGVELLGGSDNVVRGGLTPKHVALDELRRVLSVEPRPATAVEPVFDTGGGARWPSPFREFALSKVELGDAPRRLQAAPRPSIVLALEGKVEVTCGDTAVRLGPGESAFVAADAGGPTLAGVGAALVATVGEA